MCAFIPAKANWIGAIRGAERAAKSGAQAFGAFDGRRGPGAERVEVEVHEHDVEAREARRVLELLRGERGPAPPR